MEKIYKIKILKESGFNDIDYFGSACNLPRLKKFLVYPITKSNLIESGIDSKLYGAHTKLDDILLGFVEIITYATYIVFTFYVSSDENRQAFSEFIESTIGDLEFAGFPVQDARHLGEEPIDVDDNNNYKIPKTPAARKKWKDAYAAIRNMQNEAADSDDYERYIPKLADYRDRIKQDLEQEYCEKTISRIKKAGDAGYLI